MSQEAHTTEAVETHFTKADIAQFDSDDAHVGAVLGKMLSLLFVYTVIAMTICGIVTWFHFMD